MSIIKAYQEGKTELNKLKFKPTMGDGHPGNPPLIQKRIPNENKGASILAGTELGARLDDTGRIAQLFARREGLGFLSKNILLSQAVENSYKVKSDANKQKEYTLNRKLSFGLPAIETLETLASTLAQVPVAGTGTHFVKGKIFSKPNNQLAKITKATANLGNPGAVIVRTGNDSLTPQQQEIGLDRVNYRIPSTEDKDYVEDYIKFQFEVLRPEEDLKSTFIQFRAFLDSFDDSITSNWNKYKYVGRGEFFHTYDSFDRTFNISFKTAAQSKKELNPIYTKLNYLASTLAPSYSQQVGIMRGTVIRATVGNYLTSVPGYLTSFNLSWDNTYTWEIDSTEGQLPHVLNCSLTFIPIHTFTPQMGKERFFDNYLNPKDNKIMRVGTVEGERGFFGEAETDGDINFLNGL